MASSSCVLTEPQRLATPERVITELTHGREIAERLRLALRETASPDSVFLVQSLVSQLLDTFTHSLTMLRDSDEVSQLPSAAKSEDSGDSCKTPAPKDRRGCYKRKRNSDTSIKESSDLIEDGHAWRKYGQKVILNAKHPRNYFRCTHKFDQGCQASKQVQMVQDDPPLYRTTYNGQHTCKNLFKSPHHIITDFPTPDSSIIWSFNSNLPLDSIKQENKEEIQIKSQEYYVTAFDDHLAAFSSGSDHGDVMSSDVYSCTASTRSSIDDMDDIVGSIEGFFEFGTLS